MAIGKIKGPMLYDDLARQGVNLSFDGNLVYLDVTARRLGVGTASPQYGLDVPANVRLASLTVLGNTITSNTGRIGLGSISSLVVTGGAAYNVILTDGAGNLRFGTLDEISGNTTFTGNTIELGANSSGALTSNAVTLTTSTSVTDGIAQLNFVLGKLVPPAPPTFPGASTITISSLSTYRMANLTQIDLTGNSRTVAAGTTVANVRRAASYTTSNVTTVGPGDSGTVSVYRNSVLMGSRAMSLGAQNGTHGQLVIGNDQDYAAITGDAGGFWESFNAYATGSNVSPGWNEVYLTHSQGVPTNVRWWYFDNSNPGTPTFSATSIALSSNTVTYSSTIPHLNSSAGFTLSYSVNRLSGDMYPTSDNMATGTAGGALTAPVTTTYASAGVTTPLAANLYVASGTLSVTTTSNVISGFGSSALGPTVSISNSYNTGTQNFPPGATVLYKTGTATQIEETSMFIAASVGSGSGNPVRIVNPGTTDTPTYSAGASAFNSTTGTLTANCATVVAATLKHDITNYASGYLPVGPNLSTGRHGAQYYTFKFTRTAVSKFDIKYTGTLAGLWVALPGSAIDTSSTLNGWLNMGTAYAGAGQPGAGTGGNGSNGCALGALAIFNIAQTNKSVTATFGTVSSSSTATNEIYVRVRLNSGQTLTALTIEAATN
jgi:hypothetical protein